jgi:Adenylate kinase and related kinases
MKRVLIIGSSGAGKSTLARRLGEKTGLEIIHLDKIYWKPGWVEPSEDEWKRTLEKAVSGDEWIMDGNFGSSLDIRIAACDTVIFLDMPRALCIYRVLKRVASSYGRTRTDMADGCPEKFDLEFLKWIWDFEHHSKPKMERLLARFENEKTIIRLRSNREVENFLMNFEAV